MVTAKEPSEAELVPLWCLSTMVNAMAAVTRSPEIGTVDEAHFGVLRWLRFTVYGVKLTIC